MTVFELNNNNNNNNNLKRNRQVLEYDQLQQQQSNSTSSSNSIIISPPPSNQPLVSEWSEEMFELEEEEDNNYNNNNIESSNNYSNQHQDLDHPVNTIKPRAKRRAVRAPDPHAVKTDKSCSKCRTRKVRCDRTFPVCSHCFGRGEECNLHLYPPKTKTKDLSHVERERLELLEERLAQLEGTSLLETTVSSTSSNENLPLPTVVPPLPSVISSSTTTLVLPKRERSTTEGYDFLSDLQEFNTPDTEREVVISNSNIGQTSLDWRLATPQMATSLSQHLCNAFFDSCCSLLPTFNYFSSRSDHYRGDLSKLSGPAQVAVAAFCAIGARPSPHSALLGIDSFSSSSPTSMKGKGKEPTLFTSAGTRRQNACDTLTREAHTLGFEQGLLEDATQENLGAILALIQLMMFMELEPRRSRSLIRAAVGHFKDLHDACINESERVELKQTFAFAIYYADSLTSAWARKSCMIAESDLNVYFNNIGIIVPNLPRDEILPVLESLLQPNNTNSNVNAGGGGGGIENSSPTTILLGLRTAVHLLMCWTAKVQRLFTTFAASPGISVAKLTAKVTALWTAIDQTRIGLQYLQAKVYSSADLLSTSSHSHSHSHSHSPSSHSHETDFVARSIRSDRDLLDVITLIHVLLMNRKEEFGIKGNLLKESTSRVRKGLRVLAFYSKLYASGADQHMIYHHVFQLEHLDNWTELALQRFGDPNGPLCKEEEVSDIELNWFREGLHSACFFTPFPEKRLAELRSHFEENDNVPLTPPPTLSSETDLFQFNMHTGTTPSPTNGFAGLFADGLARNWDIDSGIEFF